MSSYFRTLRRHWLWLLAAGLVLAAAAWWARDNPRRTLEEVLGTRDLPASVGSVECESGLADRTSARVFRWTSAIARIRPASSTAGTSGWPRMPIAAT
jgi:hypothetical protein